jgi:NAD-dependent deacetylase
VLKISSADYVFILTGAGVSAESGIPTFRGVNGLWRNYRIEEVASPHAWQRDPRLVWEFYSMRRRVAASAKPNPHAHEGCRISESRKIAPQPVLFGFGRAGYYRGSAPNTSGHNVRTH